MNHPLRLRERHVAFFVEECLVHGDRPGIDGCISLYQTLGQQFPRLWQPIWHMHIAELFIQKPERICADFQDYFLAMRRECPEAWQMIVTTACANIERELVHPAMRAYPSMETYAERAALTVANVERLATLR